WFLLFHEYGRRGLAVHQHRDLRVRQHFIGFASDHERRETAPPVRRHHDKIATFLQRGIDNPFPYENARAQHTLERHTGGRRRLDAIEVFVTLGARAFPHFLLERFIHQHHFPIGKSKIERHHMQAGHLGIERARERHTALRRALGQFRPVGRDQDTLEHRHLLPSVVDVFAPVYISGGPASSFFVSGTSVIVASVSNRTLATETAFSSAIRTTLVGSTMPASIISTYSLRAASKPTLPLLASIWFTTTPPSTAEFSAI